MDRPLRFLTLGGSNSWGANVDPGTDSYSRILEQHYGAAVDNLSIPATGAGYSARCLQSLVERGAEAVPNLDPDNFGKHHGKRKQETETNDNLSRSQLDDVVVVEFSVNGIDHLDILLLRIRQRYPDAIVIYIDHLPWKDRHLERYLGGSSPDAVLPEIQAAVAAVGGHTYRIPRPDDDGLDDETGWNLMHHGIYAEDDRHLNQRGHLLVASEILAIVRSNWLSIPDSPNLNPWGHGGDICYTWFASGVLPPDLKVVPSGEGVELREITNKNKEKLASDATDMTRPFGLLTMNKFAFEIPYGGRASFEFALPDGSPRAPVSFEHMRTGNPPVSKKKCCRSHMYCTKPNPTKSVSREIERRAGTKKCRFLGPQPGHGHMHVKPEPSKLTREHYTCMYGMCV